MLDNRRKICYCFCAINIKESFMKKHLSILLTLCLLISVIAAMFVIAPLAEEAPRAKSIRLANDPSQVANRASDDLSLLCDGKKHFEYDGIQNFNNPGIILVQNVECETPQEKGEYDYAELIIDLEDNTLVDTVNVAFYYYYNAMIDIPNKDDVIISYSIDGENFSELKRFTIEDDISTATAGILDKYFYLDEAISCSAIKVSMPYGPTEWSPKVMLEWFGFTELSAGLKLDYENADEESSEPEESIEPYVSAAPDYESFGYTLKSTEDFFVSHFDNIGYEGASAIMTEEYEGGDWWMHIAFAPVEGHEGMYVVTEIEPGLDGNATPLEIPEGGFVWCTNYGNDYSSQGGINYKTTTITAAIAIGQLLDVGRVVCFENLDIEGKDIHSVNGLTTMWYDSSYVFNSKIHIMLNEGEDLPIESPSEEPSQEPSNEPESSDVEDSSEDESSTAPESTDESSNAPVANDENGSFPWWIIIVVVAVVAIAVVVFIIIKKKNK